MTTYTGDTAVIAALGTTVAERGLTPPQFKAKFDKGLTDFVTWFNATHIVEHSIACGVTNSAGQAIPDATLTILNFDTESFDTHVMHDTVTENSKIVCKAAGVYMLNANVGFATNGTGNRYAAILVNGSKVAAQYFPAIAGDTPFLSVGACVNLSVNDYVQVQAYQSSGGALNTMAEPTLSVVRIA